MDPLHPLLVALHLGGDRSQVALVRGLAWQVGRLARALVAVEPGLVAVARAQELEGVPEGALVLVGLDEPGARWLNQHRNAIAWRRLRVVLYDGGGLVLRAVAPDLDSWVGTWVELPPAVPAWTVEALRGAPKGRVWWAGEGLREAAAAAWPGEELVEVSWGAPLHERVRALEAGARVHFTDVVSGFAQWRVLWAMACARRVGDVVLSGGADQIRRLLPGSFGEAGWSEERPLDDLWSELCEGFRVAHTRPMSWPEAARALERHTQGALLAALVGLEPEAVWGLAAQPGPLSPEALLRGGAPRRELTPGDEPAWSWALEALERRPEPCEAGRWPEEGLWNWAMVAAALRWEGWLTGEEPARLAMELLPLDLELAVRLDPQPPEVWAARVAGMLKEWLGALLDAGGEGWASDAHSAALAFGLLLQHLAWLAQAPAVPESARLVASSVRDGVRLRRVHHLRHAGSLDQADAEMTALLQSGPSPALRAAALCEETLLRRDRSGEVSAATLAELDALAEVQPPTGPLDLQSATLEELAAALIEPTWAEYRAWRVALRLEPLPPP